MSVIEDTKILKDYVAAKVKTMEEGGYAYITGGYLQHSYDERLIDSHCSKIVSKLYSLGYECTTNHGHGCQDYKFSKKIEL